MLNPNPQNDKMMINSTFNDCPFEVAYIQMDVDFMGFDINMEIKAVWKSEFWDVVDFRLGQQEANVEDQIVSLFEVAEFEICQKAEVEFYKRFNEYSYDLDEHEDY